MIKIINPKNSSLYKDYLKVRWLLLRKPLGGDRGSEIDELEDASYHRAIIDKKNDIVGVGRIHFIGKLAQIRYMGVKTSLNRKGYGSELIKVLEKIASSHNINKIFLNSRINAIKFYEKNGYTKIKKVPPSFGDIIHYRMEKVL